MQWQLGPKIIDCSRPRAMAIVNADPESFFPVSRISAADAQMRNTLAQLIAAGPDILDIGGQSTRPGSTAVGADEELRRVIPVIAAARELAPELPITVDTYHSSVAREALAAGADGVNDISAGRFDAALLDVVTASGCGYVLMHMLGSPETMQVAPSYHDCVTEVGAFLGAQLAVLEARGIAREQVALDPGIGFGKRLQDNLALIREVERLREAVGAVPLLYGVSRKSFIGKVMTAAGLPQGDDPAARLSGSLAMTWQLLQQGVMLHRVHDVAETRQVFALWEALQSDK